MDLETVGLSTVLSFVSAGLGAYLGSYLKKKGENLATHEDLALLIDQVNAVTTTTKEIEARISSDMWDRQKQWEMKKEGAFEVMKAATSLHTAVVTLHATYYATAGGTDSENNVRLAEYDGYQEVFAAFIRTSSVASLVGNANVALELAALELIAAELPQVASENRLDESAAKVKEFTRRLKTLQVSIRQDLGVRPTVGQSAG
jgi:hypothetical protein